jgi:hypothetical protein
MASKRIVLGTTVKFQGDFKDLESQLREVQLRIKKGTTAAVASGTMTELQQVVREANSAVEKLQGTIRGKMRGRTSEEKLALKELINLAEKYKLEVSTSGGLTSLVKGVNALKDANALIKETKNNIKLWSTEVNHALKDITVKPTVDYSALDEAEKVIKAKLNKSKNLLNLRNISPERKESERKLQDALNAQLLAIGQERQKIQNAELIATKKYNDARLKEEERSKREWERLKKEENDKLERSAKVVNDAYEKQLADQRRFNAKKLAAEEAYEKSVDRIQANALARQARRAVQGLRGQDLVSKATTGKTLREYDYTDVDRASSALSTRQARLAAVGAGYAAKVGDTSLTEEQRLAYQARLASALQRGDATQSVMEQLEAEREQMRLRKAAQVRMEDDRNKKPSPLPYHLRARKGFLENWQRLGNLSATNHLVTNVAQISGTSLYGLGAVGALTGAVTGSVKAAAEAEQTKTVLAGLINTFTRFSDAAGKAETAQGNYNRSIVASENLYTKLRSAADKSILTTKELMTFYTTGYAAGGKAGLTSDQILYVVERLGTLGKATGLRELDTQQDIRSIVSPGSRLDATNKTASYLGISGKDRDAAFKEGPEAFIKMLKERLKGMDYALKTFEGSFTAKWSTFVDKIQQVGIKFGEVIIPYLLPQIDAISKKLQDWAQSGEAEKFANDLGEIAKAVGSAATGFAGFVIDAKLNLVQTGLAGVSAGLLLLAGRCALMSLTVASSPVLLAIAGLAALGMAIAGLAQSAKKAQGDMEQQASSAIDLESSTDDTVVNSQKMKAVRTLTRGGVVQSLTAMEDALKYRNGNAGINIARDRERMLKSIYDGEPNREQVFGTWDSFKKKVSKSGVYDEPFFQNADTLQAKLQEFFNIEKFANPNTRTQMDEYYKNKTISPIVYKRVGEENTTKTVSIDEATGQPTAYAGGFGRGAPMTIPLQPGESYVTDQYGRKRILRAGFVQQVNPLAKLYEDGINHVVKNGGRYATSDSVDLAGRYFNALKDAGLSGMLPRQEIIGDSGKFASWIKASYSRYTSPGFKSNNPNNAKFVQVINSTYDTFKNGTPLTPAPMVDPNAGKPLTTESLIKSSKDVSGLIEKISNAQQYLDDKNSQLDGIQGNSLGGILSKFSIQKDIQRGQVKLIELNLNKTLQEMPELMGVSRPTAIGKKAGKSTTIKPLNPMDSMFANLGPLPGVGGTKGAFSSFGSDNATTPGAPGYIDMTDPVQLQRVMNDHTERGNKIAKAVNAALREKKISMSQYISSVKKYAKELKDYQDEYSTIVYEAMSSSALSQELQDIKEKGGPFATYLATKATNVSAINDLNKEMEIKARRYYTGNGRINAEDSARVLNYLKTGNRSGLSKELFDTEGLEKLKLQYDIRRDKILQEGKFKEAEASPFYRKGNGIAGFASGLVSIAAQSDEVQARIARQVLAGQAYYAQYEDGLGPSLATGGSDLALFNIQKQRGNLEERKAAFLAKGNGVGAAFANYYIRGLDSQVDGIGRGNTRAAYVATQAQQEAQRLYDGAGPMTYADRHKQTIANDLSVFDSLDYGAKQAKLAALGLPATGSAEELRAMYAKALTERGASSAASARRADDLTSAAIRFATAKRGDEVSAFGGALESYGPSALISSGLNSLLTNQYTIPLDKLGNPRYSRGMARKGAMANVVAGIAVDRLFDAQKSYSSEGANIGGLIGTMVGGPFGAAIGTLGGGFLGSLFGKKQPDPADEEYRRTIKNLLSEISRNTRPVGDYYRTKAGSWNADSMYLSGRALGMGMVAGV